MYFVSALKIILILVSGEAEIQRKMVFV